jgi:hypothetical protein
LSHPATLPVRGPNVTPTKAYTLPAWLNRCDSRTKVCAISRTPTVANRKASGTARPTAVAVPCGLMLMAIEGAISATETPTADHTLRVRRRVAAGRVP